MAGDLNYLRIIFCLQYSQRTNERVFGTLEDSLVCESKFDWFVYLAGLIYRDLFDIKCILRPIIWIMTSESILCRNQVTMRDSMLLYNITYWIM